MMKTTNDYSVNSGRGSRVLLGNGEGNGNILIILIIVAALCCCGGVDSFLPLSEPTRRGRRRRRSSTPFSGIIFLLFLSLLLGVGGSSNGRNANTNIINVDSPRLNDDEVLDL